MLIMNFLFQHFILLCNCNTSFIFIECYFIDFKPLLQTTMTSEFKSCPPKHSLLICREKKIKNHNLLKRVFWLLMKLGLNRGKIFKARYIKDFCNLTVNYPQLIFSTLQQVGAPTRWQFHTEHFPKLLMRIYLILCQKPY